jgi:hypothetical protein
MKQYILFFILYNFFFSFSLFPQESLKSIEEEYYSFLTIQGLAQKKYLNYRTLSDSVWELEPNSDHVWQTNNLKTEYRFSSYVFRIYGPRFFSSYNTSVPYGQNDGALWQGKGFNAQLTGGVRFEGYGLEFTFKPELDFSQNLAFELMPRSASFNKAEYFGNAADYGYFWGQIDLPQRFGNRLFFTYDWGDSEIRYTWRSLTIGFGAQAVWLGPSYLNAILLSNNAPTFPKLDIGIRKQPVTIPFLNWYIGDIEFRLWTGMLSESQYFNNDTSDDRAMFHGFSLAYAPSFLKGLSLFWTRTTQVPWEAKSLKYILPSGSSKNTGDDDQRGSFGASWTFPTVGLEIFGEIGVDDFVPGRIKGYIRYPFHTLVYDYGLKKTFLLSKKNKLYGEIILEISNMELSQDFQMQWPHSFYMHGSDHGHVNKGQLMGAGSGYGGNSQYLGFTLYYPKGKSTFFIHRNNTDNDFIYSKTIPTGTNYDSELENKYFTAFKSNLNIGISTYYFLYKHFSIGGNIIYNFITNPYYFYNNVENLTFKYWDDVYIHNFSFGLILQFRL